MKHILTATDCTPKWYGGECYDIGWLEFYNAYKKHVEALAPLRCTDCGEPISYASLWNGQYQISARYTCGHIAWYDVVPDGDEKIKVGKAARIIPKNYKLIRRKDIAPCGAYAYTGVYIVTDNDKYYGTNNWNGCIVYAWADPQDSDYMILFSAPYHVARYSRYHKNEFWNKFIYLGEYRDKRNHFPFQLRELTPEEIVPCTIYQTRPGFVYDGKAT